MPRMLVLKPGYSFVDFGEKGGRKVIAHRPADPDKRGTDEQYSYPEADPRIGQNQLHKFYPYGNPDARAQLQTAMRVSDANWRGIGEIPASGFEIRTEYAASDARLRFRDYSDEQRRRAGQMPPGCDCARVVLGKVYPNQCRLYGTACTPRAPIGPCMVSDEGACRIWLSGGVEYASSA